MYRYDENEQKTTRLELLLHLEVGFFTEQWKKKHLWRSLKETRLVSFVTFFFRYYIDMSKFGCLCICQADAVRGGFSVCVSQDVTQSSTWQSVCLYLFQNSSHLQQEPFKSWGATGGSSQGGIWALHHLRRTSERWFNSDHLENKPQRAFSGLLCFW